MWSLGFILEKLGLFIENGIAKVKELIAEKITTKQICLEEDDGEKICINKDQLKQLLNQNSLNLNSSSPSENQENRNATPTVNF